VHEARKMIRQKELDSIENQIQQAQCSLDLVTKAAEAKVQKQWKEI
jgi:hypothetical protein